MPNINDNELAAKLRMTASRLLKVVRSEVKHDETLSLTERSTLSMIYQHSEILPSELAAIEKVTSQSMSQIINKLSHNSYINKTPSIADKRKVIITITSKGKEYIELKRTKSQEWLAKIISEKTTEAEKEIIMQAITILTRFVD
ncbi:MAG: MarR family transcriptional regulator [Bacteroidetes bacterium]|nr:MarR family transcriptional regulator [Bacteroidota bacterium]